MGVFIILSVEDENQAILRNILEILIMKVKVIVTLRIVVSLLFKK